MPTTTLHPDRRHCVHRRTRIEVRRGSPEISSPMHSMADMIFTRIALDAAGFALYSAAVDQAVGVAPVQAGFLLLPGGAGASQIGVRRDEQAPQELSLSQAWQQPGYFLFHPQSQALPAEP
ncbi:hypothetical protein LYZ86_20975 [Xanthomonas hortorum pv. cynarae]|nr:hypothetical protein [Xanthomonas hortorum]MCE4351665.1 hypothetical protein [Xanthomonas hortorum pv. cynarae]